MNHWDEDNHQHVTETFGQFSLEPKVFVQVFRVNRAKMAVRGRNPEAQAQAGSIVAAWAKRWARRRNALAWNLNINAIGPRDANADALVVVFKYVDALPDDWMCWAGIIKDTLDPRPFNPLAALFDLTEDEPPPVPIH